MPILETVVDIEWGGASGGPGVNVWHVRTATTSGSQNDVDDLDSSLQAFYDAIHLNYPTGVTISSRGLYYPPVPDAEADTYETEQWTVNGGGDPTYAPPGLAVILNMKPTVGTGRGQGRKYLGPVAGTGVEDNGSVTELFRGRVRDAANAHLILTGETDGGAIAIYGKSGARDVVSVNVPNKFGMVKSRRD